MGFLLFLFALVGFMGGALVVYFISEKERRQTRNLRLEYDQDTARLREQWVSFRATRDAETDALKAQREEYAREFREQWNEFTNQRDKTLEAVQGRDRESEAKRAAIDQRERRLADSEREFRARHVSYEERVRENEILKQDLRNLDLQVRKLALDRIAQQEAHDRLDERGLELGSRYLKETIKWIGMSLSQTNYTANKQRLQSAIEWSRQIGLHVSDDDEANYLNDLKREYELVVRAALEREEQQRIKARIREEQLRSREVDRELRQLERERLAIQAALEKALADAHDQHSSEVDLLRQRLAEAEERAKRAISQAQLTKAGHVYVISNLGAFGTDVYKIGLTRRLEPQDRVRELSGAAVPFPFDIHMMISSDDAPALEFTLHKALHRRRVNKANPRKEYFKVTLDEIREIVQLNHGEVQYVADAAALEYHQSLSMSEEDQDFVESVYNAVDDDEILDDDLS